MPVRPRSLASRLRQRSNLASDAQGDLLRGLQVVETACNIPTALLGDTIEGMPMVQ